MSGLITGLYQGSEFRARLFYNPSAPTISVRFITVFHFILVYCRFFTIVAPLKRIC